MISYLPDFVTKKFIESGELCYLDVVVFIMQAHLSDYANGTVGIEKCPAFCSKTLYGFAAHHMYSICDSEPICIFVYVISKSCALPPPLIIT